MKPTALFTRATIAQIAELVEPNGKEQRCQEQ